MKTIKLTCFVKLEDTTTETLATIGSYFVTAIQDSFPEACEVLVDELEYIKEAE